jgi:hypothetical protein
MTYADLLASVLDGQAEVDRLRSLLAAAEAKAAHDLSVFGAALTLAGGGVVDTSGPRATVYSFFQGVLVTASYPPITAEVPEFEPPSRPLPPKLRFLRQDDPMKNVYALDLADATEPAETFELEETIAPDGPTVRPATDGMEVAYDIDAHVTLRTRGLDAKGNTSDWSEPLEFDVADVTAPSVPGAPKMQFLREEP